MAQHRLAALRGQPLSLDWTCFGGGVLYEERFGVDRECDPELAARVHPLHELQGTPDAPGLYRYPVASGATLYVDRDPYHPTPPLCEDLFTSHSTFVTPKNVHHFLKFCNNLFYFLITQEMRPDGRSFRRRIFLLYLPSVGGRVFGAVADMEVVFVEL
jgi:hypothetical protein